MWRDRPWQLGPAFSSVHESFRAEAGQTLAQEARLTYCCEASSTSCRQFSPVLGPATEEIGSVKLAQGCGATAKLAQETRPS